MFDFPAVGIKNLKPNGINYYSNNYESFNNTSSGCIIFICTRIYELYNKLITVYKLSSNYLSIYKFQYLDIIYSVFGGKF